MIATNSPRLDIEGHIAQRVHGDFAQLVGLGQMPRRDDDPAPRGAGIGHWPTSVRARRMTLSPSFSSPASTISV